MKSSRKINLNSSTGNEILYSQPSKPLDFSFREVSVMADLLKVEPRAGKRKSLNEANEKSDLAEQKEKSEKESNLEQVTHKKKHEVKEQPIIEGRIFGDKTSDSHKHIGPKQEASERKEKKSSKKIRYVPYTNAVILHSNEISSVEGVGEVLHEIIPDVEFLSEYDYSKIDLIQWLDLSHNMLEAIHPDICELKYLKILYLHANFIKSLSKVTVLSKCKCLMNLTLHGNPIEQIKGYRFFIIEMMPCLEKLDFTLVSEKELDIVHFRGSWNGEKRNKSGKIVKYPELHEEILKRMNLPKEKEKNDI